MKRVRRLKRYERQLRSIDDRNHRGGPPIGEYRSPTLYNAGEIDVIHIDGW